ncbi:uncharacterized protein LOC123529972 [Mercenaria mercenaria]|uniref:uncharacterized protein LOC123529972 n=1 Tax=Mercenaria mercenaria TaxID=6596 RepID=UPI00234E79EF|nr:uncharacterized protein LOC123529972 [Mercenaria mercenaria]
MTMEIFYLKVMVIAVLYTWTVESQTMANQLCSQQGSTEDADCDNYDLDTFLPSKWTGNFTCTDDDMETKFVLNVTSSSSTIGLQGNMYFDGENIYMVGSFASFFKMFAMQSDAIIKNQIANRYFSKVELNGKVQSSVFIEGAIIFQTDSGKDTCPMELRRQTATVWCNGHGFCQRYGRNKEEYVCCCDQRHTGNYCEVEKVTTAPITTTRNIVPCYPVNNCTSHYYCGSRGQKICEAGWTGFHCNIRIADGPADCDVFDQEDFIPSKWIGNYTCNDDGKLVNFTLNITRSNSSIGTVGNILIDNTSIAVVGSFASFFKTFTLQSQDLVAGEIFKRNWTSSVELNGILRTSLYISGKIIFSQGVGTYTCNAELRRKAVYIDWCSVHGSCYRIGHKRNQFSCCCDPGFSGNTCQVSTFGSTASTTSSTEPDVEETSKIPTETMVETTTALSKVHTETTIEKSASILPETSATPKTMSTTKRLKLEDVIRPGCTSNGWNITVDISKLRQLYPMVTTNHIYFGDNSCRGQVMGTALTFQQGFRDCLTSERVSGDSLLYENDLFYAIYDPINPFIIRQHKWTFTIECDVSRNRSTSSHVHHDVDAHHASVTSHYDIKMAFFKDANFMNQIAGNPVHASIGDDTYVKVFTSAADWTVKMRLHTCYTKPTDDAGGNMTYFIIKNGCEVDSNTHIISQSTHETRFVFQNFEYSTNKEGLNIYCNATFCETKDYSPGCAQSCVSQGTQALVGK